MDTSMELKPIESTSKNRGQLYAALDIYREGVRPEEQNPESQILHWIDHRKDLAADEFRCFTLNEGADVIGYLQYSYFSDENVFFWEYLCLRKAARAGLGPNQKVLTAIRTYIVENYPIDFTIVFEVAHDKMSTGKRISDEKRMSYFERLGFRRVDYPYRFPVLQTYDGEISYPADLLVLLPKKQTIISAAALRTILRCLYYKHYLRWDRPFLDPIQFAHRQHLIDSLYASQISQIGNTDSFNTEGDDKRLGRFSFERYQPKIGALFSKVFGPKLPRLVAIIALFLAIERQLNSVVLLVPFILVVAVAYCLAEDTESSTKILSLVIAKLSIGRLRQ
jgi:hypothetical protein